MSGSVGRVFRYTSHRCIKVADRFGIKPLAILDVRYFVDKNAKTNKFRENILSVILELLDIYSNDGFERTGFPLKIRGNDRREYVRTVNAPFCSPLKQEHILSNINQYILYLTERIHGFYSS